MLFMWTEVYVGIDPVQFNQMRERLDAANIRFKTKVESTRSRMANNLILGGDPVVLHTAGVRNDRIYYIYVKRKDAAALRK